MMENIIPGPLVLYNNDNQAIVETAKLAESNWLPFMKLTRGEMFEYWKKELEGSPPPLKGVIITIGFYKTYLA